ncbi:MAG: transposase [Alphaproteobacteria bacterium]
MEAAGRSSGISHSDDLGALSRIDVLEGPSGRRRWPDAVKGRIVAESYASDDPVSTTARRHRLAPSQLFAWRRDAKAGKLILPGDDMDIASFAPLLLEADAPSGSPPPGDGGDDRIEIVVGVVTVRLPSGAPPKRIGAIAAALASTL